MTAPPILLVDLLSFTGSKGGMETYARELYRAIGQLESGFDIVGLASTEGARLDLSWFPGEVIASRISGENRFVWAWGELFGSARWARKRGAALVHSPATLGPWRTAMPFVLTLHDCFYWSHPELMSTPLYTAPVKWMETKAAGNAAQLITDSQVSADEIVKYLGYPRERLHVVPLAGNAHAGVGAGDRDPARIENLIVASGQRRPHKNWEGLLRGLALVDPAIRPRLVITGGRGDDPLQPVVDELQLGDWVELRGWVETAELADLHARAAAMALPSVCEGFGLPVVEAMAAGLPTLISDIPVFHEVAGDATLYFDPFEPSSIADAIRAVATQPGRLAEVSAAGRERATLFSWERTARETLDIFRLALATGPRRTTRRR